MAQVTLATGDSVLAGTRSAVALHSAEQGARRGTLGSVPSPGLPLANEDGRCGPWEAPPRDPGTPAPRRPG